MSPFEPQTESHLADFDAIRLRLASPEAIRSWSYGEVTKPETINYRTQKPEKAGLFAEEIFGPSKDWECYCGKYKKIRYKGIICDKCGVEVTHSIVRRERMGHIELAAPVTHIWFLRSVPSKIGTVLDISIQNIEKVTYFASFIIIEVDEKARSQALEEVRHEYKSKRKMIEGEGAGEINRAQQKFSEKAEELNRELERIAREKERKLKALEEDFTSAERDLKELKPLRVINEQTFHELSLRFGHVFEAGIGAEAIRKLLERIDLKATVAELEKERAIAQGAKLDRLVRRLKLLRSLDLNHIRPEWMILTAVPVIPPDLRPMVPLDGGRFATSDLIDLYRRVINRNNSLSRLRELHAPEVIIRNEKRMLQEAADALIDNSARHTKTVLTAAGRKRQLKSLADILKGKQGRFRQNLLGKRIDYSGRSVIVVGPNLRIHQCGLPKKIAMELFRPFVIAQLIRREYVHNIRSANRFIESDRPEVWDILEEITQKSLVLLNRAPTLHRLGIQAFQPILIEGKAIQVHPMVCPPFNADFDGDQMAVHVPLTEEAKKEAAELMLSTRNLLKPATGQPVVRPDKDVAWGSFYITIMKEPAEGKTVRLFADPTDALYAYQTRNIGLHEKIKARLLPGSSIIETTVGRLIINRVFPDLIPYLNEVLTVKKLGDITRQCLAHYGPEATAAFLDELKELGFKYITRSGYSWGMVDLPDLSAKRELITEGNRQVQEIEEQYQQGLLTAHERHTQIIKVWTNIKDQIVKMSKESLPKDGSVYSMMESGARGSPGQLVQMIGMKGLVSNPAGDIIELPVKGNFKEGFDVLEFFISTHGTRKGLSDTALRTANAGYLTRRLVDVAQDVVVVAEDCGDTEGVVMTKAESDEIGESLLARILGRFTLSPIKVGRKTIVKANELITEAHLEAIGDASLEEVQVRSVMTCRLYKGICQKCYGYDLAYNKLVLMGTAVGIIAAQSIGEPGTQLTMRTFHTGGVAGVDITQGLPRVEELFEARPPKHRAIIAEVAGGVEIEQVERRVIESPTGKKILDAQVGQRLIRIRYAEQGEESHPLGKKDALLVEDGATVIEGQGLIERLDGASVPAAHSGRVKREKNSLKVLYEGQGVREYVITPGMVTWVKTGDTVAAGDQLTEGDLDLQQLFAFKSKEAVQRYLLKEVQSIYTSQGQKLNNKHIELMIRQMFSRVYVRDAGDTELLPGEIVERARYLEENERAAKKKGQPAEIQELLLGITKVSLSTESFLSSASFQETAKVLINAAVTGKVDHLEGLKENVIIGRLIPAGSGFRRPVVGAEHRHESVTEDSLVTHKE
ncbi:DNA-directed RNA polymerase subunit beta' [Candidatus Uhrbacteria bacterium]|nr:DNA-directed RNA polymerase subunit beta' [Candidatus Uhrbacteria bacterium]